MAAIERRGPGQFRALIRRKGRPTVSATFPTRELAERWAAIRTPAKVQS